MCNFFSFMTEPENNGGKRFYFDWEYRKEHLNDYPDPSDSHSRIAKYYGLNEDKCNKYEYDPLTKKFTVDRINSSIDDIIQAEEWVNNLDFKRVIEPLIIKPIVNPFELPKVCKVTDEHKQLLKEWASAKASVKASVKDSVGASVWSSVGASVWSSIWSSVWSSFGDSVEASVRASAKASVGASVLNSVLNSVGALVMASVLNSVGAYVSSFFDIKYDHDFFSCVKLWEMGLVPSFDGTTWRLHSGNKADIVFEITDKELRTERRKND